jgi:hypothetical protein
MCYKVGIYLNEMLKPLISDFNDKGLSDSLIIEGDIKFSKYYEGSILSQNY